MASSGTIGVRERAIASRTAGKSSCPLAASETWRRSRYLPSESSWAVKRTASVSGRPARRPAPKRYPSTPMHDLTGGALDARLRAFLDEDIGGRDLTTEATVPAAASARGRLLAKSPCVLSGLAGGPPARVLPRPP